MKNREGGKGRERGRGRRTSARRAHVWIKLIPATHSEPNYECRQRSCHAPISRTAPLCHLLQLGKLFCFLVARVARTSQAVCQQFVAGVAGTRGEAARGEGGVLTLIECSL